MAKAATDTDSDVQSNAGTTEGGVTGKGFKPGQSGNPSGRPRGIARRVRDVIGDDGDAIVGFWGAVLSGEIQTVRHVQQGDKMVEVSQYEEVSVADRIAVSKLLAERGWGKPPQFAPIEDADPLEQGITGKQLAADFDAELDELAARRRKREAAEALSASAGAGS